MLIAATDIGALCSQNTLGTAIKPLSETEKAAIYRMRLPLSRAQRAGGYLLRNRLLAQIGVGADEINVGRFPSGKPYLTSHPELSYSISHSGYISLCALTEGFEVGADIEQTPSSVADEERFERLARRCFAEKEQKAFAAAADPVREFYRLWTRKEALFKFKRLSNEVALVLYDSFNAPEVEFAEYKLYDDALNEYICSLCVPAAKISDVPARIETVTL